MKNYDIWEKYFQISDPIESYFECIVTCDGGMVDVFLGVWKYLKKITVKLFSYFIDLWYQLV